MRTVSASLAALITSTSPGVPAITAWLTGWTTSPTMRTSSVSAARASSVGATAPSVEFSMGTSARSTAPSSTASTASETVGAGTASHAAARGSASSAAWE